MVKIYKPFFQSKAMQFEVAIDIGHGSDTFENTGGKGVVVNGVRYEEHDFNSRVGVELNHLLEAIGFKVIMYQKPYSPEIGLNQRINFYNAMKPDLVWSIHANANSNDEVDGCCAFYWYSNSAMRKLALEFGELVRDAGYHTHGNGTHASTLGSWTNLAITRATTSDAVLTENGFMTNDEPGVNDDFELLFGSKKDEYAREIARIHAIAICKHFGVTYTEDKVEQVSKPAAPSKSKSATAPEDRLGEVVLLQTMNYRREPSLNSEVIRVLPEGHGANGNVHYYDVEGDWLRLGAGWVSNAGNKYVKITKVYSQKAAASSKLQKTDSIVDYLNALGKPSSPSARAKLAPQYGIKGYKGTAAQNTLLLDRMRSGWKAPAKKTKEYVHLPASTETWRTYRLNEAPRAENSDWSLTPSRYGGLEYEVLGHPQANVVTIKTSRGKRNIYVAPSTGAKVYKK